jgi:group I intron endonuclease
MIIYKITNKINGKVYIGKHCGVSEERWKTHLKNALDSTRPEHLYRAMKKYGVENFIYEIIDGPFNLSVGDEFLNKKEKEWIKKYKSRSDEKGYNMTEGGDGLTAQYCSTKTKEKQSDSQDTFDYAAYSCSSGRLFKVFKKRNEIQKELPQVAHVRHINHACNANDPYHKGKKYNNGVAYGFMWIKLKNNSNFPERMEILPACNKKQRIVKKKVGDNNEIAQYTLSGQLIKTYPNVVTQVAKEIGTEYSLITNALEGKSSSHMNFIWRLNPKNTSPQKIEGLRDSGTITFTKKQMTSIPIIKKLDGKEVSKFDSAIDVLITTNMKPTELFICLNDGIEDSQGFSWSWIN